MVDYSIAQAPQVGGRSGSGLEAGQPGPAPGRPRAGPGPARGQPAPSPAHHAAPPARPALGHGVCGETCALEVTTVC